MLRDLHVRDLAVLAEANVRFGPGLNVLSGETGGGKSLVVDSLALLAGTRASTDLIRLGSEQLTVCGVFAPGDGPWRMLLEEAGLPAEDDEIVVRREISRSGRNRVFVNDEPVTLRLLARLAPALLRIHTQREELGLFSPELQRRWLDRSGGPEAAELLARTARLYAVWARRAERLRRSRSDERLRWERLDLLRFQAGEIDAAALEPGEEIGLRQERDVLRNSEAIVQALGASQSELAEDEGAAVARVHRSLRRLQDVAEWEPRAAEWIRELEEIRIRLDELGRALASRLEQVEADPARLNAIEERLATIERLCRKYGDGSEEVLERRRRVGRELEDLLADDEQRDELERRVEEALAAYREAALELSARRRVWGEELAAGIHGELADLAMGKARFSVALERRSAAAGPLVVDEMPTEPSSAGIDQVVFRLLANPGEEERPLSKVASGGELSRVYLALQLAAGAGDDDARPTLIFDEVDAGIGGAEAAALGRKLQRLAGSGQILVVTHLPQVASFADRHFRVSKRVVGGRTEMRVRVLSDKERVQEVARMLAGKKVTDLSRSHARELIDVAARGRH